MKINVITLLFFLLLFVNAFAKTTVTSEEPLDSWRRVAGINRE